MDLIESNKSTKPARWQQRASSRRMMMEMEDAGKAGDDACIFEIRIGVPTIIEASSWPVRHEKSSGSKQSAIIFLLLSVNRVAE